MSKMIDATQMSDALAGAQAATRLADHWPDVSWIPSEVSEEWARGAVSRFAELIREQRAIFLDGQKKADRGASRISPRAFQGIIESLQNADDQSARELRLAVRERNGQRELLLVHDGDPAMLQHVGAMVLPWLSTKATDADASGRWGVGQKTLQMLGGPLELHCSPYHVRIDHDRSGPCAQVEAIPTLYDPAARDTLLRVPLFDHIDIDALEAHVKELGSPSLLFMRTLRSLAFVDIEGTSHEWALRDGARRQLTVRIGDDELVADVRELRDSRSGHRYTRYDVQRPVDADGPTRIDKATGGTTPLGVAVPMSSPQIGRFHDRVPTPTSTGFPAFLNAQFEPDPGRSFITEHDPWNEQRLKDLGELLGSVAVDLFVHAPPVAWNAVPTAQDADIHTNPWFRKQFDGLIHIAQTRFATDLRLERDRGLGALVYEVAALDGLLEIPEQRRLRPGAVFLATEQRDHNQRWRRVLAEIRGPLQISVEAALELLDDQTIEKEPAWFIAIADAAINAELVDQLVRKPSVVLADGRRIVPPAATEPRTLVRRSQRNALGARLGATLPMHRCYGEDDAGSVVKTFRSLRILLDDCIDGPDLLGVLARRRSRESPRVRVDDDDLLVLRDLLERIAEETRRKLGARIGENLELRCSSFDEGGVRLATWASPSVAYLPARLDRERYTFQKAAAGTPGLTWLNDDYDKLLKRAEGRQALGARRLLTLLGATSFPRLVSPPNERSHWSRDPRPASGYWEIHRPRQQTIAISTLANSGKRCLLDDRWSPDLDAVIRNLGAENDRKRRRERATNLLGNLARGWDRHFAPHATASAVYGDNGYWTDAQDVVATWLARAAEKEWLPNGRGTLCAPGTLALRTEVNRQVYGRNQAAYLTRVDDQIARSPVLAALGVRRGPTVDELIETLKALSRRALDANVVSEVRSIYALLAHECPAGSSGTLGGLTRRQARDVFARSRLVLADEAWHAPAEVFKGTPVFGARRCFVDRGVLVDRLWDFLGVPAPTPADYLDVLREISNGGPLTDADRPVVMESLRALAATLTSLSTARRTQLRRLPLWTAAGWTTKRPLFACDDDVLAEAARGTIPIWDVELKDLDALSALLQVLKVDRISWADFVPCELNASAVTRGQDIGPTFAGAVAHLKDELARGDQALHDSIAVPWRQLMTASVLIAPNLELEAALGETGPVRVPAEAYVIRDPTPVVVARDSGRIGDPDAGGRAIAALFRGDRQKLAWAWSAMWARARSGAPTRNLTLSSDHEADPDADYERLTALQGQASARRAAGARKHTKPPKPTKATIKLKTAPLKDLGLYEPDDGTIINHGQSNSSILFPPARQQTTPKARAEAGRAASSERGNAQGSRTVPAPVGDREQLAFDVVRKALQLGSAELADLRARRGIGADAVDELRQLYEIKMASSSEMPNEIWLTRSEAEAAELDDDFFLAVVSGLTDDGGELRVRFIFNPLSRLGVRLTDGATLVGVNEVEGLEYRFSVASPQPPVDDVD